MNILIINFEYPPLGGGGGVATKQLAEYLAKRHTVTVITTHFEELAKLETAGGVSVHRVAVWGRRNLPTASLLSLLTFVPAALMRGWKLCREKQFDVINAQFVIPSGIVGSILSRLWGVPLVVSFIGGDLFDPSKGTSPHRHAVLRWLVRRIAAGAAARTAISNDTKQQAIELHKVTQPIVVTHLGIEPTEVAAVDRAELQMPTGVPVFVSIGRLIPRKNYALLLEAWQSVADAHLIILGSGPLEGRLRSLIDKFSLTDRVQLRGFVDEQIKLQLLAAGDGYVSAAEHEGFGIVFLEAMQAGLPIVATNVGGQTDFLKDGVNAVLVAPNKAKELALGVEKVVSDQELSQRMGRHNREEVKNFYLDKTVAAFERVLISAVNSDASHN